MEPVASAVRIPWRATGLTSQVNQLPRGPGRSLTKVLL
jgi:hypothetical protein